MDIAEVLLLIGLVDDVRGLDGTAARFLTVSYRLVTCPVRTLPFKGRTTPVAFPLALTEMATVRPSAAPIVVSRKMSNRVR